MPLPPRCAPRFAQEVGFSDAQTSAFFSIMKATIDHASAKSSSQPGGGGGAAPRRPSWEAMEANFEHFRKLILAHSTGTGDEEPLFTLQDVKAVTSFVTKRCGQSGPQALVTCGACACRTTLASLRVCADLHSFYRHYAAYAAVFCSKQPTAVWARSAVVETPLRPPPLSQVRAGHIPQGYMPQGYMPESRCPAMCTLFRASRCCFP